mmetsp:Transcript_13511/g.27592  ORF Transcript_13511/g.27592 Transcript_13511/m.27592 type:complete len:113 (+) Transcript_13511:937-1275(+)|eukprot:CAMPEP_0171793876 /NCGR_PEP_ID=MMETSP0991-20121206/67787_1 /TAXON_ID=483369 /ORGANISM="non described non described, Strain CCMP2098" /LENGTH=112 /DNA_ID=CAMNT_0012404163 /DNA_START=193 /DNA_END=531 /DNA_ORIENTATION=-
MITVTNSHTSLASSTAGLQHIKTKLLKRNASAPFSSFSDGTKLNNTADRLVQEVCVLDLNKCFLCGTGTKLDSLFSLFFSGLPVFEEVVESGHACWVATRIGLVRGDACAPR